MEGFGNIQYQPEIPWLYKSVKSYQEKPKSLELSSMIFEPVQIRGIMDLLNLLGDGYTVQKGQLDYLPGIKYTTRKGYISEVNPNHIPAHFALLPKHWEKSNFIFFDIDDCEISPIEFINNLTYKPTGAYHSFNGEINGKINPETGKLNYRFRLIYAFRSALNKDQWYGAEEYLENTIEADNEDVAKIDGCSRNIAQAMHGTNGRNKIIQLNQEKWYSFAELNCPEIHKEEKANFDIAKQISIMWPGRGTTFLKLLQQPIVNFSILKRYFGNELKAIYRVENLNNWKLFDLDNATYAFQLIDKNNYLQLPTPKGYNSKTGQGKIAKGNRKRWLTRQAKRIRIIQPDILPQDMIYTLFWLRDTFVKYRDGNDFIGASDIMNIASKAFSYDITDLRYLNKAWIKKEKKRNKSRTFILNNYKRIHGAQFDSYIAKDEKKIVRKYIIDNINNQNRKEELDKYYQSHPLTTPISVIAEELNWDEETVKKHIALNLIPAIPEKKPHKPHKPHKLKYTEDEWRKLYDPSLSVRENMKRMKLSQEAYYNHIKRYKEE